jgi:MoaA/NifB/PqqE/SkfB family radical SAM enzyme
MTVEPHEPFAVDATTAAFDLPFGTSQLDLSAKLGNPAITQAVTEAAHGRSSNAPVVVELDPTSFCDLSCPECISASLLNQSRFSPERLMELATEFIANGVRAVILIGGGEPLMHPATTMIMDVLHDAGIAIGLTTNGTQLPRHVQTIARRTAWTRVSVDAATAESYARFRPSRSGRNAFPGVIDGMRQLAACKRGTLGYSFLLMSRRDGNGTITESNFGEVLAAGELACDIGCDYVEVKPEYDMEHYLIRQDQALLRSLADQLRKLDELRSDRFSVLLTQTLKQVLHGLPLTQPKDYDRCLVAELRTLVTPRGAYICPYHRGNDQASYGDPSQTSFTELWHGSARQEVMARIKPSSHCKFHCIRDSSNRHLLDLARSRASSNVTVASSGDSAHLGTPVLSTDLFI